MVLPAGRRLQSGVAPMRVFLIGATGVLGRELVRQFVARGDAVVGSVRSERGQQLLASLGAEPRPVEVLDAEALTRAGAECEVVIHAATAIPDKFRPRGRDWEANDRLRRQGTQALVQCARRIGARAYLQQSIVWLAAPPEGGFYDEDSPAHPDRITQSALDGEQLALEAAGPSGLQSMVLRCGMFYGPEARHTRQMADLLRQRRFPVVGQGTGLLPLLHVQDAAGAFVTAAQTPRTGRWHIVDEEPAELRLFLEAFARQLGAPPPRRIPLWLARWIAGRDATQLLTAASHTSNRRFRQDFSWSPRYPTFRQGLQQIIEQWRKQPAGGPSPPALGS